MKPSARHPERNEVKSRDPVEVPFNVAQRDLDFARDDRIFG
jgi:hypothetical protein